MKSRLLSNFLKEESTLAVPTAPLLTAELHLTDGGEPVCLIAEAVGLCFVWLLFPVFTLPSLDAS